MRCEDMAALLTEFLEGELSAEAEAEALDHLAGCNNCETVLGETRDVVDLARSYGRPLLDADAKDRILRGIRDGVGRDGVRVELTKAGE